MNKNIIVKGFFSSEDFRSLKWCSIYVEHTYIVNEFTSHRHGFSEAFIILSGQALHVIGDNKQLVKRGNIFVIKGDTLHGFYDVHELELINLMYLPSIVLYSWSELQAIPGFGPLFIMEPELRRTSKYPHMVSLSEEALAYVIQVSKYLEQHINSYNGKYLPVIHLSFKALLAYLAIQLEAPMEDNQPLNRLAMSIRYMHDNLANPISLTDIANNIFVSTRHIQRLFNKYYGMSPIHYLTRLRLDNALRLIIKEKCPISEAALQSGYPDPAHFSRVFKENYGLTPNDARRLLK